MYIRSFHKSTLLMLVVVCALGYAAPNVLVDTLIAAPRKLALNPGDDLQAAINQVPNNGVIELNPGTYAPPPSGIGINNTQKNFTIRAVGSPVVIDGAGNRPLIRFINSDISLGGVVTFEGITFSNGFSNQDGIAGGVTLHHASGIFRNCTFEDNVGAASTVGGAVMVAINSNATFFNCEWTNNVDNNAGGGLAVNDNASATVTNSVFTNNRTNLPNHAVTAAGGAIHVGNSSLVVNSTVFTGNQAGYVGGAIFVIGNWQDPVGTPRANVTISDSTFTNNRATRDPSVSFAVPTEGGAFHAEDQTTSVILRSRFSNNVADTGGGINLYRAIVTVQDSVLINNRAVGSGGANGFGAAINAISNDGNDGTTNGGTINRRSAQLTVRDTLIQGASGSTVAQTGGGLLIGGDVNHQYGINGVPQMGSNVENRATALLERVIFDNTDVEEVGGAPGSGVGGAIVADLANLTIRDSLLMRSDAEGAGNGSGGALAILNQSSFEMSGSALAENSAGRFGGAVFIQGSQAAITNNRFFNNVVAGGQTSNIATSFGAAIFGAPDTQRNLPVTGNINNNIFSRNQGLSVFDDDRNNGPINDLRYDSNQFYETSFGANVYRNALGSAQTASSLNGYIVNRSGAPSTDKSSADNVGLGGAPVIVALLAVPSLIRSNTPYYIGFIWDGDNASLDGSALSDKVDVRSLVTQEDVTHALIVQGAASTDSVDVLEAGAYSVFVPYIVR